MAKRATHTANLDKRKCAALRPAASRYRVTDTQLSRLKFVVEPSGRKYWSLRYVTSTGKNSEIVLGSYPDLLPDGARKAAQIAAADIAKNRDPAAKRREQRQHGKDARELKAARRANAFEAIAQRYLKASEKGLFGRGGRAKAPSTLEKERQHLGKHVYPALGSMPVAEIRRRDVLRLRDTLAEAGTPGAANSCVEVVRRVLAFALEREAVEANVALGVPLLPTESRAVIATEDQLKVAWAALEATRADDGDGWASATILELALLTLQRRAEVSAIHQDEIDWKQELWTLNASRKKERRAAKVPLCKLAIRLLKEAFERSGGDWAFPSREDASKPIRPKTVTRFMARLRKRKKKQRKELVEKLDKQGSRVQTQPVLPDLGEITPHDLRRTARTALTGERLGIDADTAERVLNHVVGTKQSRTYDVNSYLKQKRLALNAWEGELLRIVTGEEPASNVVKMPGRSSAEPAG